MPENYRREKGPEEGVKKERKEMRNRTQYMFGSAVKIEELKELLNESKAISIQQMLGGFWSAEMDDMSPSEIVREIVLRMIKKNFEDMDELGVVGTTVSYNGGAATFVSISGINSVKLVPTNGRVIFQWTVWSESGSCLEAAREMGMSDMSSFSNEHMVYWLANAGE